MATKKFENYLAKVGARPDCEICGHNTWSMPQDEAQILTAIPTVQIMQNRLYPTMPASDIRAFMVVCLHCGNIRFHAEVVVKNQGGL
jgi:hypothetical protein